MVLTRSVQETPQYEDSPRSSLVLMLASAADSFEAWGRNLAIRDQQLRAFWPTEPTLASAVYTVVTQRASFSWTLEGPPRTVKLYQDMLHEADLGKGWLVFTSKVLTDILTQDNGAFIEIIHAGSSEDSPVIGIAHLDAGRCRRTGVPDWPVVYVDRLGREHRLAAHQVITWEEFPSPVETMNGAQLCAVSRVLRAAQLLRDIGIYLREKAAGTSLTAIHLVSGIKASEIDDAIEQHMDRQRQKGLTNYMLPAVLATLDPTATISHEQIDLASLPDNFDLDVTMRWYINQLALGFGIDYQDLAPLPGSGLGTGAQSLVLHMKSRGKGPAMFIKSLEHKLNFHGVLPRNVTFRFDEQDTAQDMEIAELDRMRAETDKIYIDTGVLPPEAVRQELLDRGKISQELFDSLQLSEDLTEDIVAEDNEQVDNGAKAVEAWPAEREGLDEDVEDVVAGVLAETMSIVRRRFERDIKALLFKASPYELLDDNGFWEDFRVRMLAAYSPEARKIMRRAADRAVSLGLSVNMDMVNEQLLDFTRTYTNEWWMEISDTTRAGLRKALINWQETGLGPRGLPDLIDSIEPLFGRERAARISATEVTRLFDEGSKLANLSAGIEREIWRTVRDSRVDDICSALDKEQFGINEGPRPPLHPNCLLPDTRVIAQGIEAGSRAYYSGPVLEIITQSGNRLTVTPNHEILTPHGWVMANYLRPGDDVISDGLQQRMLLIDKDIQHMPPTIEEVFSALDMVERKFVEGSDFNGDGRLMQGDIDIVAVNGELRCTCNAPGLQPIHDHNLCGRDMTIHEHTRLCSFGPLGVGCNTAFSSLMRRTYLRLTTLLRHLIPLQPLGFALSANVHTCIQQSLPNNTPSYSISLRDRIFRPASAIFGKYIPNGQGTECAIRTDTSPSQLSPQHMLRDTGLGAKSIDMLAGLSVQPDRIIQLNIISFTGHVFDLQTIGQLYTANGIIVHNCRCLRAPVVDGRARGR